MKKPDLTLVLLILLALAVLILVTFPLWDSYHGPH
jgi:hypothetical protein